MNRTREPQPTSIVILDEFPANAGDLDWDDLRSLGDLNCFAQSAADQVVARAKNADIVLTNKVPITAEHIEQLPRLKYIGLMATGYDSIDVSASKKRDIIVTNVPAYGTDSVAQLAFAHILHLAWNVAGHGNDVKNGEWNRINDWCFWNQSLVELNHLTLGIVGYGRIGHALAQLASAAGMHLLAHRRHPSNETGVDFVELEELLEKSDIVSLHCPLTTETQHLIDADRLARMKSTAWLINTARGGLVDSQALAEALREGKIAGAGVDVLDEEPPGPDHPLVQSPRCLITPHLAWGSLAARRRLRDIVVGNVQAFLAGDIVNRVT